MGNLKAAGAWVESNLPLLLNIGIAVGAVLILIFK